MKTHNLIIIGSGPAGLTAALYAARAGLNPLVIEGSMPGGQLMSTTYIENWPGIAKITGAQLMQSMREHAQLFGTQFALESVVKVDFSTEMPQIITQNNTYSARSVIIATGATPKKLHCPGEEDYWNKGVTTCAVCDGAFFRDRKVVIVGGGDTAMENASFMTNFTKDITIIHILDALTASKPMQERVINHPFIRIIYNSTISRIEGDGKKVTGVLLKNQKTQEETQLLTDAVFVAIGNTPNTAIFGDALEKNAAGYLIHAEDTQTSRRGVFAAGDVVDFKYRQAITSAGEGCKAALDAERYLKKNYRMV